MTSRELSRYLELKDRLEQAEQLLDALESAVVPGAQVLTGMPHNSEARDRIGDLSTEITVLKKKIERLKPKVASMERQVIKFIDEIEDECIQVLFRLKFVRCLSWKDTAIVMGGNNTPDGIKSMFYRYMKQQKKKVATP